MNNNCYKNEEVRISPTFVVEEASRCLLCHDAPCSKACPAGTNPAKFIRSLRFRNINGAIETIRENNILGGICSRICPTAKYCEGACSRTSLDTPIEIGKLQQYLTDYENDLNIKILEKAIINKDKVAVIGSGPSGLSVASELAKIGYSITVFEAREKLGGWLSYGIPEHRLPQSVVDNEIDYIKDLGVEFKCNCKIGEDLKIEDLRKEGFKAFLIATGTQKSKEVDSKTLNGIYRGVEFLARVKGKKEKVILGDNVIVIGGGDVAIDCATTAKILGAKDVKIIYRRGLEKMPAERKSLEELQDLNIPVFTGFKPSEIIGKNGKVFKFRAVGMFDDSIIELPASNVIFAIGQEPKELKNIGEFKLTDKGLIVTENYKTNLEGIFASGDVIEGDNTVVLAVQEGKEAAKAIDFYLSELNSKKDGER